MTGMVGKPGVFGPAVIGQQQYDAEQKIRELGEDVFGPLVTGKWPEGQGPAQPASPTPPSPPADEKKEFALPPGVKAAAPASIADVEKVLTENPAAFDILFAAELERPEGPRKGAMRLFRAEEENQGPGARVEVLAKIAEHLGE